jgi:hypothetical protein
MPEILLVTRVALRLAIYRQSARLGAKPLETHDQYFSFQLNTCGYSPYVISSLTRGWVYRLQLLMGLASAVILGSKSRGTPDHTVPDMRLPQPVGLGPRIYISQEQGGPITPRHWVPVSSSPTTRRARWRYSNPPPHGFHLVWHMYLWLKEMIRDFYKIPDITLKIIVDALIIMITTRSSCFNIKMLWLIFVIRRCVFSILLETLTSFRLLL